MSASLIALALATTGGEALAKACEGKTGWSDPAPPAQIAGNVYYVGTCGITALLVTSPTQHFLIDGATAEAAPGILANIRKLGFDPRDVRWLLSSHEHVDHAGGLAAIREAIGAHVAALEAAKPALESGKADADDPQAGSLPPFKGVHVDFAMKDGESVEIGALKLTARATPGHTAGSTSWTWLSCEGERCVNVVYADSLTAVSADGYRFSDHPSLVARFRESFEVVAKLDCDLLITPHPSASNLFARLSGKAALIDPNACRAYAQGAAKRLDDRLDKERSQ